jgi:hypothetical protein
VPTVVWWPTAEWQREDERWQKRDLWRYVYLWADEFSCNLGWKTASASDSEPSIGITADDESDPRRVCEGPPRDRANERLAVAANRQADGAALRRIKGLAPAERHKINCPRSSQASGRRRRDHPRAGKPHRLIASSPNSLAHGWLASRDVRSGL